MASEQGETNRPLKKLFMMIHPGGGPAEEQAPGLDSKYAEIADWLSDDSNAAVADSAVLAILQRDAFESDDDENVLCRPSTRQALERMKEKIGSKLIVLNEKGRVLEGPHKDVQGLVGEIQKKIAESGYTTDENTQFYVCGEYNGQCVPNVSSQVIEAMNGAPVDIDKRGQISVRRTEIGHDEDRIRSFMKWRLFVGSHGRQQRESMHPNIRYVDDWDLEDRQ